MITRLLTTCRINIALLSTLLLLPWALIGCGDGSERREVKNTAPRPVAAAITIARQTRGTTRVQPGDADAGQQHTFAITTPPAHGLSSVDATGLVTYAPQAAFTGADSLSATVTDNGQPPMTGTVTVGITVTAPVVTAPKATVTFPGPSALLTYTPVTVRGTAEGPNATTRVTVDGVLATSTDGFATWAATIPLAMGPNQVVVSVEDARGTRDASAATTTLTRVAPIFAAPSGIAVEAQGTLVVTDERLGTVFRVQPTTGERTVVSDLTTGDGPALVTPEAIEVEANGQLVVVDTARRAVFRIDPVTGTRSIVSDATRGSGPVLERPRGIAVALNGQLMVVDLGLSAVLRIDPVTGARTIFSSRTLTSGPGFTATLGSIAVESTGALVIGEGFSLIRIDPNTGNRSIISAQSTGGFFPSALAVAPNGLFFALSGTPAISQIDPATGAILTVTDFISGSGPLPRGLRGIAVLANGQLVVTTDKGLMQIDPTTQNRTKMAYDSLGSGASMTDPLSVAVTIEGQVVVTASNNLLHRVDPATGARTILTALSPQLPVIVPPVLPLSVAVQATGQLAVTRAVAGTVFSVDPTTGAHGIVADASTGSGADLGSPVSIQVAADGQWVVATAVGRRVGPDVETQLRILLVHPITGVRTLIADCSPAFSFTHHLHSLAIEAPGQFVMALNRQFAAEEGRIVRVRSDTGTCTPLGAALTSPRGVAVEATGHIVVLTPGRAAVLRLDPATGSPTVLADQAVGRGPLLSSLAPLEVVSTGGGTAAALLQLNDGIAVEATGHLLIADPSLDAILRLDPSNGDRVIISR